MSRLYEIIGRLVVSFVRSRYRRELRAAGAAAGAALIAAAAIAYLLGARRDVEEG